MLEKITFIIVSLVAAGFAGYYLSNLVSDKAIEPKSLPESARSLIDTHFPEEIIAFSKKDNHIGIDR